MELILFILLFFGIIIGGYILYPPSVIVILDMVIVCAFACAGGLWLKFWRRRVQKLRYSARQLDKQIQDLYVQKSTKKDRYLINFLRK